MTYGFSETVFRIKHHTWVSCGDSAADQEAVDVGDRGPSTDGIVHTGQSICGAGACSDERSRSGNRGIIGQWAAGFVPSAPGQTG